MNQESTFRKGIILYRFEHIRTLVAEVERSPGIRFKAFRNVSSINKGTFPGVLKDAKVMQLITNGHGFFVTDLGKKFVHNFGPEVLKEACLNAAVFEHMYEKHNIKNRKLAEKWLYDHCGGRYVKHIGTAALRYKEGVLERFDWDVYKNTHQFLMDLKDQENPMSEQKDNQSLKETLLSIGFSEDEIVKLVFIVDEHFGKEKVKEFMKLLIK